GGPPFYRPNVANGLIVRNKGYETAVQRWTEWSAEGPVIYEQLQHWLCGAVVNVSAPTGGPAYIWLFTRPIATLPTLASFTFERREYDGSTAIDHAWHYAMVRKLTLSAAAGEPLRFAAEGFARIR